MSNATIEIKSIIVSLMVLFLLVVKVDAQTFPAGFSRVKIATISNGTAMAFAPDGRLFICQKNGVVKIFKNGALLSTPFLTLTVDVNGERGLGAIAFDPNFSTNHYVYFYYTATTPTIHNRLSRFTANGDVVVASSELVLLDLETVNSVYHNGGGLGFGTDGKLYLAVGEDNSPNNAQSLTTYKGKLLRLNADGTAASGNPYYNSPSQVTKRIWDIGLRNPYNMAFQPGTGKLYINNVGAEAYEEIHDGTPSDKNFGWPAVEGNSTNPVYTNPVFAYPHESTGQHGCAITGGTFFNPSTTNYPSAYFGKYFYMEFCNGWMYYITPGTTVNNTFFSSGMGTQNLALLTGPDGNLYYINRKDAGAGIYKIIYTNNNAPVITSHPTSRTVTAGQPASFQVSATGSPTLMYQWKKNGSSISGANSSTYSIASTTTVNAGQYSCLVTNSHGSTTSNNATLTVLPFNAAPQATIITPPGGAHFRAGDTIYFSGNATDAEDGTLPASAFQWEVEFHHNNNHFHPGTVIPHGIKTGSFVTSNTDHTSANVFYRLQLDVTDSDGLTDTAHVDIHPITSTIDINSQPSGLQITFDSQHFPSPFSILTVEGLNINIGTVASQNMNGRNYVFDHWLDGNGNMNRVIHVGPGDSIYTAVFMDNGPADCDASGTILREYWANVNGYSVSDIPVSTTPTSTSQLNIFEGPSNVADNYGSRIRGYICVPVTGNYTFWIASDNNSELWLSSNDQPNNKVKIASVTGWTGPREWTKYASQQSAPITLSAGGKYYVEALHKEGTQGDHVSVGWQLPGGTMERPIPGLRLLPFSEGGSTATELISAGASWKYLDNGSNQGAGWKSISFNDNSWNTGNAELGYGDGGEATVVSYGPSSSNKYITTYFRKKINLASISNITGLELSLIRDDGAVVYLNGVEVYRSNLPTGTVNYNTLASTYIDGLNESTYLVTNISSSALVVGDNVIAVEIHQNGVTSSDISFNLKLKALTSGGGGDDPEVVITSPANNTSYSSPANITINASVTANGNDIHGVEFFQGNTMLYDDHTAPYSYTWMNVPTGNYALKAVVITDDHREVTSPIVNVSVVGCSTPIVTAMGPTTFCDGSVVLKTTYVSGNSYQWKKDGNNISVATSFSYTATGSGDYQVRVIQGSCISWSAPTLVREEGGLRAAITPGGPTTFCTGGNVKLYANTCAGYTYQWKKDGAYIGGANASTYTATSAGSYQVQITQNGNNAWSALVPVTINNCKTEEEQEEEIPIPSGVEDTDSLNAFQMKVFPNPNTGLFTITLNMATANKEKIKMTMVNLLGQVVYSKEYTEGGTLITETIELDKSLPIGVYTLQVAIGNKVENTSVVLSK